MTRDLRLFIRSSRLLLDRSWRRFIESRKTMLSNRAFLTALILLLGFKLIYIPCELSLNSVLAQTYATWPDEAHVHAVELLGRFLSGIAALFLIVRLAFSRRLPSSIAAWTGLAALFLSVELAVVFGQKALINMVAAHSSGEVRREAVLLRTLPTALNAHHTEIEGFAVDGKGATSQTFLALAPALEFYDRWESLHIEKHIDEVLFGASIAAALAGNSTPAWNDYQIFASTFHRFYSSYNLASGHVRNASSYAAAFTSQTYRAIESQATAVHAHFQAATTSSAVWRLHRDLSRYFSLRFFRPRYAQAKYQAGMKRLLGENLAPEFWCDGVCPGSLDFIQNKLRTRLIANGLKQYHMDPRHGYDEQARDLANLARGALTPFGAQLPINWRLADRGLFSAIASRAFQNYASRGLAESTKRRFGHSLPVGLPYEAFAAQRGVQNAARYTLHHQFGVTLTRFIDADWSRSQFESNLLQPAIIKARLERSPFVVSSAAFADGGRFADRGRRAVTAILVPVVSLVISLFFGLWNIVSAITLVITLRNMDLERRLQRITLAAGALICVAPFAFPIGLAASPGFRHAIAQVTKHSALAGSMLSWIGRTEPGMLNFANTNREIVWHAVGNGPMAFARANYSTLARIDCLLIRDCSATARSR